MNDFTREKEKRLIELIEQELEIFTQILELTQKQTELLEEDKANELDHHLDHRQGLIEKINGLHQESDVLMQSYIEFSAATGGRKIDDVETVLEKLREVIAECAALNDKNIEATKEKTDDYTKQIVKLSQGKKSVSAYMQDLPNEPEMFDKKT